MQDNFFNITETFNITTIIHMIIQQYWLVNNNSFSRLVHDEVRMSGSKWLCSTIMHAESTDRFSYCVQTFCMKNKHSFP